MNHAELYSDCFTAKRLRLRAQGSRLGYPGLQVKGTTQPQRGCDPTDATLSGLAIMGT